MIFVNDQLLTNEHPEYKWVEEELVKLSDKKIVKFVTTRRRLFTDEGGKIPFPPIAIPTSAKRTSKKGMTEIWRWSDSMPSLDDKGRPQYGENTIMIEDGSLFISPELEVDKAFYFLHISPILKKGFVVEDLQATAEQTVKFKGENSKLQYQIYADTSELNKNESKLREVASSWGVANADSIDLNLLREGLYEAVMESNRRFNETKRGIPQFLFEIQSEDPSIKYRSLVQRVVDKGYLKFNNKENAWYFVDSNTGTNTDHILSVLPTNLAKKDDLLIDFARQNPKFVDTLNDIIKSEAEIKTKYSDIRWDEFKKLCKERGVASYGKVRAELEKELVAQDEN